MSYLNLSSFVVFIVWKKYILNCVEVLSIAIIMATSKGKVYYFLSSYLSGKKILSVLEISVELAR